MKLHYILISMIVLSSCKSITDRRLEELRRGAEAGCRVSIAELGDFYCGSVLSRETVGSVISDQEIMDRGIHWYKYGASLNSRECLYKLGLIYVDGIGVKRDVDQALRYFKKAAKFGYDEAFIEIGLILYHKKKYKEAYPFLKQAEAHSESLATIILKEYKGKEYLK